MKKFLKILCIIISIIIVLGLIFCVIDNQRISKGEEPIFCLDASGGSIICYFGLGYTIYGTYDDVPGSLENAKTDTWIGWLLKEAT